MMTRFGAALLLVCPLSAAVLASGCGGGGGSTPAASTATVTVSPDTATLTVGGTLQLTATAKDASGNALGGKSFVWTSSSAAASVSSAGLVTASAAGSATVTASVDGKSGAAQLTLAAPVTDLPSFDPPFDGDYPVSNFLDHDIPKEFVDTNGHFTTFWGEDHPHLALMTDGHSGYDFLMPVGTPIKAVAAGTVTRVDTSNAPFFCPPLNRNVTDQMSVYVNHTLAGGVKVQSWYVHISQAQVAVGDVVTAGQQIALSGNTGCTTAPHLHFEVFKLNGSTATTIDPYGWTGTQPDPWAARSDGAVSIQLWKAGKAPKLWRQFTYDLSAVSAFAPFFATTVAFEGVDDQAHPNNEYLDLTLDPRFAASAALSGTVIHYDMAAIDYTVPAGYTLSAQKPVVRLYSGAGTNDATTLYVGQAHGIISDQVDDCVRITYPGGAHARFNLGGCP
jgi:murein DD-endopeptidase MepM/ murein hydrolase activator NlpD